MSFNGNKQFLDVFLKNICYYVNQTANWMDRNLLVISPSKTKSMFFLEKLTTVSVGANEIVCVEKLTCLGVVIDKELHFCNYINSVTSRVHFKLRKLCCTNLYIHLVVRKKLSLLCLF